MVETNYINWTIRKTKPIHSIDEKDRKILSLLSIDSRISLKQISKKLKISKVAVFKRIKKLKKLNIITGYSCFIDFQKLGFDVYHLGIKVNMTHKEKEEYIKKISKNPYLSQILILSGGKWDFFIRFFAKRGNIQEIISYFDNDKVEYFDILQTNNFIFENRITEEIIKSKTITQKIDKKDIILLYELAKDSSQPIIKLSTKIKLSPKQVIRRIKRLKQEKIILLLPIYTNPVLYGDMGFFLIIETKTRRNQEQIIKTLVKNKNSTGGIINLQNPNIITIHAISDLKELNKIEDDLALYRNSIKTWNFLRIEEQIYYHFFPDGIYKELSR